MARARNIKPGFFRNADLVELPMATRLLFAGLWTLADRAGRLEDRPKQIKMDIFPADDVDVDAALSELTQAGMLERYAVDGRRYLQITNFGKHQNPHRDEKASTIPPPGGLPPAVLAPFMEVPPAADSASASGGHHASTMQTPCDSGASTVAIGLIPESLSPDSLQPESNTPPPQGALPVDNSVTTIAQAVCVVLESENIQKPDPADPELVVLLGAGADAAMFQAAAQTAVTKGNPRFAYVLGIVRNKMQQAAALAATALALPVAAGPPHSMRVDMSRMTVPAGRQSADFERMERESKTFKPVPRELREQLLQEGFQRAHAATTPAS